MIESKKKIFTASVLFTLIFYSLANGYRFFHSMFAGDSLYMIYQNDAGWEISIGRYVQPFLVVLRGAITSPFLISVLSLLWVSLSVYFAADFLEIRNLISIALIAAIMSCNVTILSLNATFLSYMDFYLLALFLSILGVWLMKKEKLVFLISGSLILSISLGIYQSYICVSIALVMIHFLYKMPELPTFKCTVEKVVRYLIPFMAAAIVYYTVWKVFLAVFDIWTADTYNGMDSIGDYSETGLGSIIVTAYQNVLNYFIYPESFVTNTFRGISMSLFWSWLIRFCNLAILLIIISALISMNKRRKTNVWQKAVQLLIIALFPLGVNFVCIVSKGVDHALMIYAFYFVYIAAVKLVDNYFTNPKNTQKTKSDAALRMATLASVAIISWSNIVYSNQVYLKVELQDSAAHSIMTRIVYKIESMEEYIPGVTPVAFSGNFDNSPNLLNAEPFNEISLYGVGKSVMTYPGTDSAYLSYILNVNMNIAQVNNEDEIIRQMPVYPAEGSIAFVDGILVVKISE